MELRPGNKGQEVGFPRVGAGKGVNLGGGDSVFICITSMCCAHYRLNLLF